MNVNKSKSAQLFYLSVLLNLVVYAREFTWNHFGTIGFWIIAFMSMGFYAYLGIMLIMNSIRLFRISSLLSADGLFLLLTFVMMLIVLPGMR